MFGIFKSSPSKLDKILNALNNHLPNTTVSTKENYYELDFEVSLPENLGTFSFRYNAIRQEFYGSMLYMVNSLTIFYFYSFDLLGNNHNYVKTILWLRKTLPQIEEEAVKYQQKFNEKKLQEEKAVGSFIDKLIRP